MSTVTQRKMPVGLGTMIANLTSKLGIPPYTSCERRRVLLDAVVPNVTPWRGRKKPKRTQPEPGQGGP